MYQYVFYPVAVGAWPLSHMSASESLINEKPDAFERLPLNLTAEEIRAMVREVIG